MVVPETMSGMVLTGHGGLEAAQEAFLSKSHVGKIGIAVADLSG